MMILRKFIVSCWRSLVMLLTVSSGGQRSRGRVLSAFLPVYRLIRSRSKVRASAPPRCFSSAFSWVGTAWPQTLLALIHAHFALFQSEFLSLGPRERNVKLSRSATALQITPQTLSSVKGLIRRLRLALSPRWTTLLLPILRHAVLMVKSLSPGIYSGMCQTDAS